MTLTAYARRNDLLVSFEESEMADAAPLSIEEWGLPLSSELFWVKKRCDDTDGDPNDDCEKTSFWSMVCGTPTEMAHLLYAGKTAAPDTDKDAILSFLPFLPENETFCIIYCLPDVSSRGVENKAWETRPDWMTGEILNFVIHKLLRIPDTVEMKVIGDLVPDESTIPAVSVPA